MAGFAVHRDGSASESVQTGRHWAATASALPHKEAWSFMGAQPRHATDSLGTPWDGPATLSDSAGSLCRPLQASAKMSLPQIEGP